MTTEITKPTKKLTAKQVVAQNLEALRGLNAAGLFQFSRENGFDSRAGFPAFKRALLEQGIDYTALRDGARAEKAEALNSACAFEVTLYSDAKARCDRFAICDRDGDVVWFGRFFDDDADYNGEQSTGELSAAKKAIWLTSKVKEAMNQPAIRLSLIVDANWLCTLSGKAEALAILARKFGIDLNMQWIPGTENPADKFTTASGYLSWKDCALENLARTYSAAAEKAANEKAAAYQQNFKNELTEAK